MGNEVSYQAPRNPASDVLILNGYQKFQSGAYRDALQLYSKALAKVGWYVK